MPFTEQITASHHVVCEGPDDIALFCRLIRDRAIADIQAGCGRNVNGNDNRCLGTSGFPSRIVALKGLVAPLPITKGIIIATDGDDDASTAFTNACQCFIDAGLAAPAKPYEIKSNPGSIKTAVIVLPSDGKKSNRHFLGGAKTSSRTGSKW